MKKKSKQKVYLHVVGLWLLFGILAVLNAAIRENFYKPRLGDLLSHQISTVVFVFVILGIMYLFFNHYGLKFKKRELWMIGFVWLIATVIFEFVFGHYVFGNSWERLFTDYNIFKGRIWPLVLFFTFTGPRLVKRR